MTLSESGMAEHRSRAIAAALVLVGAFGLMEWAWFRHSSLYGLAAVSLFSAWALARVQKPGPGQAWPLPSPQEAFPELDRSRLPSRGRLLLAALGLACIHEAYQSAMVSDAALALAWVAGAALCWRGLIDVRPRQVPAFWLGALTLLVMATAVVFRFYRAGEVPQGLIHWDESLIYAISRDIVFGKREIFNTAGNDGQWPYWTNAAAIHLFGQNILGFRMSPMLSGLCVVGLIALLGRELGGGRLGLVAGAFTSMAVWPVAFSRAEYLLASSYLPVLGCIWLLLWGLRRGSPLALALSGLCFGNAFSVYNGGKVFPLFVAVLVGMMWWRQRDWREPLRWAVIPFVGGVLIALSPMILWYFHAPQQFYDSYFGKLNNDYIVGANVVATHGLWGRFTLLAARVIPNFQKVIQVYTTIGDGNTYCGFFRSYQQEPFVDRALLFLVLPGMATCLARFRKPEYALMFSWWILSFLPVLVVTPEIWPFARRMMMNMPATMLLASVGLLSIFEMLTHEFRAALSNRLLLLAALGFFGWYAAYNWDFYFNVINKDMLYLSTTNANYVNGIRAALHENEKSPVYLVSFRKPNVDSWFGPEFARAHESHLVFLDQIPQETCEVYADYFTKGGFFGALDRIPAAFPDKVKRDPLVVLTPFHFYLEPLLLKLGGERVEEVMPAESNTGTSWADFGFAPHAGAVHRMIRLKDYSRARLDALRARWSFPYVSEELIPPASLGTRESLSAKPYNSPEVLAALAGYQAHPERWRADKPRPFSLADVYFWTTVNYQAIVPMRLRASWTLDVPADGLYALGASATMYTALKVDGRNVFKFLPETNTQLQAAIDGFVGDPVQLTAGPHRLDVEQICLTGNGIVTQALRLVWKRPGQGLQTLPIEMLEPTEIRAQRAHGRSL